MAARGNRRGSEGDGLDRRRGVFMISVAAELAEMHPQTLRMYESRGLINPKRSPKNTRLYSYEDVERLRRIQQMTAEEGLNLAGVETVLTLERELERARAEVAKMRERAAELERQMDSELARVRSALRGEIVPYGAYEPPRGSFSIRIDRKRPPDAN
jgi:MerR family transcriptional regulator/heat shock protein HspR